MEENKNESADGMPRRSAALSVPNDKNNIKVSNVKGTIQSQVVFTDKSNIKLDPP